MISTAIGICVGSAAVTMVELRNDVQRLDVQQQQRMEHRGDPKATLRALLQNVDLHNASVVFTGRGFKEMINGTTIPEPLAIEYVLKHRNYGGRYGCVASLGAENFIVYPLQSNGTIDSVISGNKCASGTGEFFMQQIGRMDLAPDEAIEASRNEKPYEVSGRCSVFCKSDCTHALNKGIPKGEVVAGLSKMIAEKTVELLNRQKSRDILLIGGVTLNTGVVRYIRESYPDAAIPDEALYFEALGAALFAAESNSTLDPARLYKKQTSFQTNLPPLDESPGVIFKQMETASAENGDECVLGLDVGSTTTKAVLIRKTDRALLAKAYLRTNGNPVQAALNCYAALVNQVPEGIQIIGLGTTGSGRHIAALHALTSGVINEIIAHAVAAAYFDPEVDTIFEIGGQDAKYTFLTNGIAGDYAMNEACSAGTGSFLEEAAKESLDIAYTDIADIAFKAEQPVNFNDQCAAFISSDIKNAGHEGISREDIVAGLVYSICMNYLNRVKGSRPAGKKVFMQGGVCYNKAVPAAMANLLGKEIVVPPEPGLVGAFGVALEIANRIDLGLYQPSDFSLQKLLNREFRYVKSFTCMGGTEKCDLKCNIALFEVEGKKYPFGGACSKYFNQLYKTGEPEDGLDYVKIRQELVFGKYASAKPKEGAQSVGISKSFLANTLYPLFYNFFTQLGFRVELASEPEAEGMDSVESSFCYPVEISHGLFSALLNLNTDYIFLPHITNMFNDAGDKHNKMCVFVQGESYYLQTTFREKISKPVLAPVFDLSLSLPKLKKVFGETAVKLGRSKRQGEKAFEGALEIFRDMQREFKAIGKEGLNRLSSGDFDFGVVLFGRAYNAFAAEANLNIPHKFASRNILILPHDFLPVENYESYSNMYWYSGHQLMRAARFVKDYDDLFGVFITNFSCGPDSFILPYFRKIMGSKPSLTLELDSHSADVGIDTRIDAALDIVRNYRELIKRDNLPAVLPDGDILQFGTHNGEHFLFDRQGKRYSLSSPEVEVILSSMGTIGTKALAAVFSSHGIRAKALPVPTAKTLQAGRGNTSCKECLPFILTTGGLVEYLQEERKPGMKTLFFMPHGYGPCRQGQYIIRLKDIIREQHFEDVGILTMDDEKSYADLGDDFFRRGWVAVCVADACTDIYYAILALAQDRDTAEGIFNTGFEKVIAAIAAGDENIVYDSLEKFAESLKQIELKEPLETAKKVSLTGEIYVRREEFSLGKLIPMLTSKGFVIRSAPVAEYIYYCNYVQQKGLAGERLSFGGKTKLFIKDKVQEKIEARVKKLLAASGLLEPEQVEVKKTIDFSKNLVSDALLGECVLTTGLAMREILDTSCGIISIGPFNCMPSRLAESILNKEMNLEGKYRSLNWQRDGYPQNINSLPFLHIETDGNDFPQITQSRIEIFMMQAEKLHEKLFAKPAG